MSSINVVVNGVNGRMGQEVLRATCREPDMQPVGGADFKVDGESMELPDGSGSIPVSTSLPDVLGDAQVVVDFTNAEGALDAIRTAAPNGVNVVVGSTGIPDAGFEEAGDLAQRHEVGVFIAPNFALGAVLMGHLARVAAPYFDYADLTELHHEMKIDAPSGTPRSPSPGPPQRAREATSRLPRPRRRSSPARAGGHPRASSSTAPACPA